MLPSEGTHSIHSVLTPKKQQPLHYTILMKYEAWSTGNCQLYFMIHSFNFMLCNVGILFYILNIANKRTRFCQLFKSVHQKCISFSFWNSRQSDPSTSETILSFSLSFSLCICIVSGSGYYIPSIDITVQQKLNIWAG